LALFFSKFDSANSSCTAGLGDNVFTFGRGLVTPGGSTLVIGIFYDANCTAPYYTDTFKFAPGLGVTGVTGTGEFDAPNGAILGVLSVAQQLKAAGSIAIFGGKGTYKAVAGVGQPPVRTGLACSESAGLSATVICQEGVAQDFPALKMALGTVANITFTLTQVSANVVTVQVNGGSAKLATGKLGGLSIAQTSPTTLGFQGPHSVVATGSITGSSPALSVIPPTGTQWTFTDVHHATKFSISTAFDFQSNGKVVNSNAHTTALIKLDKSGTGTIAYSDKSDAKITNWTLGD